MTGALRAAGYPATLHEVPDLHNYTAWRDAFDPYLTRLLQEVGRVSREVAELWSDAIGAAGTVIRYGHWGRPVLGFPSEQGRAWDFENNGMVEAVAGLIDAGRLKLYCVDSFDAASWSNQEIPVEERARQHGRYESWILRDVLPWIYQDCGGLAGVVTLGCSLGAYHAANFALKRADLFRRPCASRVTTTPRRGVGGASGAPRRTSTTPSTTSGTCMASISTGCAAGSACCWCAVRASGRTPPGHWTAPGGSPAAASRGIRHELDLWGHDVPH